MSDFSPQAFLKELGNDLVCYDLEFVSGGSAHKGYEFNHPSGMYLGIDVDAQGSPMAMTLVHKKGTAQYETATSYDEFVNEAGKALAFAKAMVAFAKVQEMEAIRRQELEDIRTKLQNELMMAVRRVERFGEQRQAA